MPQTWENLALCNNQHKEDQGYAKITNGMSWHDTTQQYIQQGQQEETMRILTWDEDWIVLCIKCAWGRGGVVEGDNMYL